MTTTTTKPRGTIAGDLIPGDVVDTYGHGLVEILPPGVTLEPGDVWTSKHNACQGGWAEARGVSGDNSLLVCARPVGNMPVYTLTTDEEEPL